MLNERQVVERHNAEARAEALKNKVTLDNVFELAGQKEEESDEDSDDSEDDDLEQEVETKKSTSLADKTETGDFNSEQDQGFTRAKVLILTPFKSFAYDIISELILHCN